MSVKPLKQVLSSLGPEFWATAPPAPDTSEPNGLELTDGDGTFLYSSVTDADGTRYVTGYDNNAAHPTWGNADQPFVRIAPASYGDTGRNPHGVVNGVQTLANERTISNVISNQDENHDGVEEAQPNTFGTNLFLMSFGQFFDHGLDFTARGTERYSFTTETGGSIALTRGAQDANGDHINTTSPFIDQNQTYGSVDAITYYLRTSIGIDANGNGHITGKSANLLSGAKDGSGKEDLPTYREILLNNGVAKDVIDAAIAHNDFQILAQDSHFVDFRNVTDPATGRATGHPLLLDINPNANPAYAGAPGIQFDLKLLLDHYVGGDGRLNENIALTPVHTIWHREHDYQVDALRAQHPGWSEEQLFQAAKVIVEAEYQHTVVDEFSAALAGGVPEDGDYDPNVNPTISDEFANAVYRVGHSMINETIALKGANGQTVEVSLIDAFLNPQAAKAIGVDAIISGTTSTLHQSIDENLVNAVRNQLLGERTNDLAAINIARGREAGLPSLNELRKYLYEHGLNLGGHESAFGHTAQGNPDLKPYAGWADFASHLRDPSLVEQFKQAYGYNDADVNKVDIWIGGLAEKPVAGQLGSTFGFVYREQIDRLHVGDRFYYTERLKGTDLLNDLETQSFADIVMRNSGVKYLPDNVFLAAKTITMGAAEPEKYGGADNEVLVGNGLDNKIGGGGGADTLYGEMGNDTLWGGDGNDGLRGGGGNDNLFGENGNDRLMGGGGNDVLDGGDGEDRLAGGAGNDRLYGGGENDVLLGNDGNDHLVGGDGDDRLVGGYGNDTLYGQDGNDRLEGGTGADKLYGEAGNDTLDGGAGNDRIDGGQGLDTVSYSFAEAGVTVSLLTGKAAGKATGTDKLLGIENVTGSAYADKITGDWRANTLDGGGGNDKLLGCFGSDTLIGGAGRDWLSGGDGNDTFVFKFAADSGPGASTRDVIADFKPHHDKIDISAIDANAATVHNDAFTFIGGAVFHHVAGELRVVTLDRAGHSKDIAIAEGDTNGDGYADFQIEFKSAIHLHRHDFVL